MMRIVLLVIAGAIAFGGILLQHKEKGFAVAAMFAIFAIAQDVFTEGIADIIWSAFPEQEPASAVEYVPGGAPSSQWTAPPSGQAGAQGGGGAAYAPSPEAGAGTAAPSAPAPADPLSGLTDLTGQTSVSGSLTGQGQTDSYRYTAPADGTYQFDSGLGYGKLTLQLDNAYGGKLESGSISLSAELEAGKTYILRVNYTNTPLDYTISIGVPNPVTDITGQTSVSGSLTYLAQSDRYTYTADVSGVYWFNAVNLNFNALSLEVRSAQGEKLGSGSPSAAVTLEAGKSYTLCVEPTVHLLDYTVQINVPNPPVDVTAQGTASGTLTYYNQKDQYYYTAPADGTYCFDTGKRYGGVTMKVEDENGNYCGTQANVLTLTLKAGTRYVLWVYQEYANPPIEYAVSIAMQ